MNSKIDKKQYLRYMKTFVWAIKKDTISLADAAEKRVMINYPVDATTVEDAINFVETGEGLRDTNVSMTDLYAMKEALQHLKVKEEKKEEKPKRIRKKNNGNKL
jgi:hypothetical protein